MTISDILNVLADGRELSPDMAAQAFHALMDGQMTPAQAGAFLLMMRARGESPLEMGAAVEVALSRANLVTGIEGDYMDIVGTGGDGKLSFNCSTATALTMAGLGYPIVKHGNRAVSSACGAGDVLESLGYPLDLDAEGIRRSLLRHHFAFCFAPNFHPSFRNISPIRRELGVRTLFNLLGPLINPSRPTHMMLGVANPELVPIIGQVLARGGYSSALVFCGAGGYDEITAFGPAAACRVEKDRIVEMVIDPVELGFHAPDCEAALRVESREEASRVLRDILQGGGPDAMREMVALNVAVAISLFDPALDRHLCVARARKAVADGVGANVVRAWGGSL